MDGFGKGLEWGQRSIDDSGMEAGVTCLVFCDVPLFHTPQPQKMLLLKACIQESMSIHEGQGTQGTQRGPCNPVSGDRRGLLGAVRSQLRCEGEVGFSQVKREWKCLQGIKKHLCKGRGVSPC